MVRSVLELHKTWIWALKFNSMFSLRQLVILGPWLSLWGQVFFILLSFQCCGNTVTKTRHFEPPSHIKHMWKLHWKKCCSGWKCKRLTAWVFRVHSSSVVQPLSCRLAWSSNPWVILFMFFPVYSMPRKPSMRRSCGAWLWASRWPCMGEWRKQMLWSRVWRETRTRSFAGLACTPSGWPTAARAITRPFAGCFMSQ